MPVRLDCSRKFPELRLQFGLIGPLNGPMLYWSFAFYAAKEAAPHSDMTSFSEKDLSHDLELGIEGFRYSHLFDAVKLKQLAEIFYLEVEQHDPLLSDALNKYIAAGGEGVERRVESKILTDAAPYLSDLIARLFKITDAKARLARDITIQNPIWKYKFFVQRRAAKKYKPEQLAELNEATLWRAITEFRNAAFDETLIHDDELAIAEITCRLLEAEEKLGKTADENSVSIGDTVSRIQKAYERLKDTEFGSLFSEAVIGDTATGDLLTIKAALGIIEAWSAVNAAAGRST